MVCNGALMYILLCEHFRIINILDFELYCIFQNRPLLMMMMIIIMIIMFSGTLFSDLNMYVANGLISSSPVLVHDLL